MAQTFRKILCFVDFDDNSMVALEMACKVAVQNAASLCLMHVVEVPAHSTEIRPEALKPYPVWEREAKLKLDRIASEQIPSVIRGGTFTHTGFPAGQITAAAEDLDVDLIVMATHGDSRSAVKALAFGKRGRTRGTKLALSTACGPSKVVAGALTRIRYERNRWIQIQGESGSTCSRASLTKTICA